MSDNIFDRLAELLSSPGPVNWKLAAELGRSVAGPDTPVSASSASEFEELTRTAELHLAELGVELGEGTRAVTVVGRAGWLDITLRRFDYLLEPLAEKLAAGAGAGTGMEAMLAGLYPALLGMQAGAMAGQLSQRVLAQFDVGLPTPGTPITYVVPNLDGFIADHNLEPAQARLWVALHEVAHHSRYRIPWVDRHFRELMSEFFAGIELDPEAISSRLPPLDDPEELARMLENPQAMSGLLAGPQQHESLERIQAFLAMAEGYGDHVVSRSGEALIPELPRLQEALYRRRAEPSQGEQMLVQLVGLELNRPLYRDGSQFCAEVERRWGEEALAKVWTAPDNLPALAELTDPVAWAARVLLS